MDTISECSESPLELSRGPSLRRSPADIVEDSTTGRGFFQDRNIACKYLLCNMKWRRRRESNPALPSGNRPEFRPWRYFEHQNRPWNHSPRSPRVLENRPGVSRGKRTTRPRPGMRRIGHTSCPLTQPPGIGVMPNPYGEPLTGSKPSSFGIRSSSHERYASRSVR